MKNPQQVQAWMFELVVEEDLTVDTAFQRIRREDIETFKFLNQTLPHGQGSALEAALKETKTKWEQTYGPVSRNYMRMSYKEVKLRGELIAALHQLETTDPRDIRDIVRHIQVLNDQDRETWMGPGQPPYIVDAIELLEASAEDLTQFAHFRATLDELYPPAKHDDDDVVAPEQAADAATSA